MKIIGERRATTLPANMGLLLLMSASGSRYDHDVQLTSRQ